MGANEEEPAAAGDLLGVGVGRDSATEEGARDVEYCEGAGEGAAVTSACDGSGVGANEEEPPPQAICSGWAWAGIVPPKKGPETSNIAKEPEKEPPLPQQAMALAWAAMYRCAAHTMLERGSQPQ